MNLAVPTAPPGPRAPLGGGEGTTVRDKAAGRDFAAALSETASEQTDDSPADGDIAKAMKAGRLSARQMQRAEANGSRGDGSGGEANFDSMRTALEPQVREAIPASAEEPATSADGTGAARDAAGASAPPANAMRDALAARDVQGVRDLLAALASDAQAQPDKSPPIGDLMARLGKHLPEAARSAIAAAGAGAIVEDGLSNLELFADISDETLASAKVVRQETHFQPVGQDVRRLPTATPIANDDRMMEMSLAAATKTSRQSAGEHERPETPLPAARPIETIAAAAPVVGGEQPIPGSIGQQIADGVQRALANTAPTEQSATQPSPRAEQSMSATYAPALRTIKLQLNPLSLGTVTVVLSGRDAELSIRLEAELAETVGKVEQDRGALSARLAGAGYGVSEVTVARMGTATSGSDADQRDSGARAGAQAQDDGGRGRSSEGGASSFNGERAGGRHDGSRALPGESASSTRGGAGAPPVVGISYTGRFRPV